MGRIKMREEQTAQYVAEDGARFDTREELSIRERTNVRPSDGWEFGCVLQR